MSSIKDLIQRLEDPTNIKNVFAASSLFTLKRAFDLDNNVQEIIKSKDEAERLIISRIRKRGKYKINDISLSCFCYILGKTGSKEALPELHKLLTETHYAKDQKEISTVQSFATHAAKVITKQRDLKGDLTYEYKDVKGIINKIKQVNIKPLRKRKR